ncbi:MAG TPA: Ku protein [Candidatus Baltobacteraceae bacterium]|nr:Ku protein [Candidatus Baltobacteraceae bacterium]
MARSMWRGAVQFGLVTIPVKLYLATESNAGLSFNLLHKTCLTRVQMRTWCPYHEEYISRADTVRGFEYAKGQYVVIDDVDLENVPLKTVRSIEIETFVPARVDGETARFVKSAYYLEPEPIGRKAFYLLQDVLREDGLSAICKIVIKDREALAAIDPYQRTMLLSTLYWPDEVRSVEELDLPDDQQTFKPAEVAMARNLVAAMTTEFDPAQYHDEYRAALLKVIEAKVAGEEVEQPAEAPKAAGKLVDLMSVLEASVAAARATRSESKADPEPRAKAQAPAKAEAPAKAASARRKGRAVVAEEAGEEEAAPVRRRKSA